MVCVTSAMMDRCWNVKHDVAAEAVALLRRRAPRLAAWGIERTCLTSVLLTFALKSIRVVVHRQYDFESGQTGVGGAPLALCPVPGGRPARPSPQT